MSFLRLPAGTSEVTLLPANATRFRQSTLDLQSLGRLEMQFFTMSYLMTMQNLPQFDRKIVGFGVLWTLAIAAAVTWIIA